MPATTLTFTSEEFIEYLGLLSGRISKVAQAQIREIHKTWFAKLTTCQTPEQVEAIRQQCSFLTTLIAEHDMDVLLAVTQASDDWLMAKAAAREIAYEAEVAS